MILKPALTPDFCLRVIVNSTPSPSRFDPIKDEPADKTLFDLGIVDSATSAIFIEAVKARMFPWHIDNTDVASSPDTDLQTAANSVQLNAF